MTPVLAWFTALWQPVVLPDRWPWRYQRSGEPPHDLLHESLRRQLDAAQVKQRQSTVEPSRVLIVEDDAASRTLLAEVVRSAGLLPVTHTPAGEMIDGPAGGLAVLRHDPEIALLLTDVWMPAAVDGIGFIRQVRREWPDLPLVAITAHPSSLAPLRGTPDSPPTVFEKPINVHQVRTFLRMLPLVRHLPAKDDV